MSYRHLSNARSIEDLKHNCNDHLELRLRIKSKGFANAYQCQFCGEFKGNEVSKSKVSHTAPKSDEKLSELFWKKYSELSSLDSSCPTLSNKPNKKSVPEDNSSKLLGLLEECCKSENTTLEKFLPTYLFKQQNKVINDDYVDVWGHEDKLKSWFNSSFSEWFYIYPEVEGVGLVDCKEYNIKIDYVIKAKQKLIVHGFTDEYLGIEVKHLNPQSGNSFHSKSSCGVFQALSYGYSNARWKLSKSEEIQLQSILIFSNFSFNTERKKIFNTLDSYFKTLWNSYLSVVSHASIGELIIYKKDNSEIYWSMKYAGNPYFTLRPDGSFKLANTKLLYQRQIGFGR